MSRSRKAVFLIPAAISCACVAFWIGRASAGGIPLAGALTYAGKLEDATGAPLSGEYRIQVNLWNSAEPGDTPLCQTQPKAYALDLGHFAVPLPDACTDAIHTKADVWTEVLVNGTSLGSTKLGAVPYAIEAAHALSADKATRATAADTATTAAHAGGELGTQINSLASRLGGLEGRMSSLEDRALTVLDVQYVGAADAFHDQCVSNPLYCGIAAHRRCQTLGYREGWFMGETSDGFSSFAVMCVR